MTPEARERVAVVINTFRDDQEHLVAAIRGYLDQENPERLHAGVIVYVSTVEGDPSVETVPAVFGAAPDIIVHALPESKHPGRGPQGIYAQLNDVFARVLEDAEERNIGWLTYASGTDEPLPAKLHLEVKRCIEEKKLVCYSSFYVSSGRGKRRSKRTFRPYSYKRHVKGNFVSDCALMRLYVARNFHPFQMRFGNHAYWDFWLRVYEGLADVFAYNPEPTWVYYISGESQHVQRKRDPEKEAENERMRAHMLSFHG